MHLRKFDSLWLSLSFALFKRELDLPFVEWSSLHVVLNGERKSAGNRASMQNKNDTTGTEVPDTRFCQIIVEYSSGLLGLQIMSFYEQ